MGLKILNQLVDEMNSRVARRTLTQQRRITVNFRDKALLNIFEIALGILNQLASCELSIDDPALADSYADEAFGLVTKCLTYDFIGTNPDESSEEIGTLQIPSTWRDTILSPQTMALFFRLYRGKVTGAVPPEEAFVPPAGMMDADEMSIAGGGRMLDPATAPPIGQMQVSAERAAQALECLTLLVSVRRSIFGPDSVRKQFLVNLIRGICDILANETVRGVLRDCHGCTMPTPALPMPISRVLPLYLCLLPPPPLPGCNFVLAARPLLPDHLYGYRVLQPHQRTIWHFHAVAAVLVACCRGCLS